MPDVVAAVIDRSKDLRAHAANRPILLAEFGLADERWRLSPRMEEDERLEHFHNALWASALSGLSGTAMFWWWEQLERRNAYGHYQPLSKFVKTIPFAAELEEADAKVTTHEGITVVGLQCPDHASLWIYNADHAWERGNPTPHEPVTDSLLQLPVLQPGRYKVDWWDTWTGRIIRSDALTLSEGTMELPVPPFQHDVACHITRNTER
jgi:hypothetical protein